MEQGHASQGGSAALPAALLANGSSCLCCTLGGGSRAAAAAGGASLAATAAAAPLQAGMFPDVAERLALGHLAKGDQMSALITGVRRLASWRSVPSCAPIDRSWMHAVSCRVVGLPWSHQRARCPCLNTCWCCHAATLLHALLLLLLLLPKGPPAGGASRCPNSASRRPNRCRRRVVHAQQPLPGLGPAVRVQQPAYGARGAGGGGA